MTDSREITFRPAFHRCHPNPSENYGIGGVEMLWTLRKDGAAITWLIFTDWGLPDDEFKSVCPDCDHPMHQNGYPSMNRRGGAMAGEVRWHLPSPGGEDCKLIGAPCETSVGFSVGDDVFRALRIQGGEAVWAKLAELLDEAREAAPA